MLKYIKNAIIPAAILKTITLKGDTVHILKNGTAYAEVRFNGSDTPVYVQRHIPAWVK